LRLFQSRRSSSVRRLSGNPIVTPAMLAPGDGDNICGPSLIAAPSWLPQRLGRFYLYFAHHQGTHIRLAVADNLAGPWRVHHGGTLQLADATGCRDHIASPDVHVDVEHRLIRMYFHAVVAGSQIQRSFLAVSTDGVRFRADPQPLANFYLRALPWRGEWIGMAKGGALYRSPSGVADFRALPRPAFPMSSASANEPGDIRHVALAGAGDDLVVYFSRIGDAPERILRARIDLARDPANWQATGVEEVIAPETPWEGATLPLAASRAGVARGRERALRDPAVFTHDGAAYLLYSVAGESGIAIAELPQ
jgi:hypothetical protein